MLLPETTEEAVAAVQTIMGEKAFGAAGDEVVIEEFLEGEELSVMAFSDGYTVVPLPAAQDHKRAFDGDQGPNTGGMGAYAPAPLGTPALIATVVKKVLKPTVDGMRREGIMRLTKDAVIDLSFFFFSFFQVHPTPVSSMPASWSPPRASPRCSSSTADLVTQRPKFLSPSCTMTATLRRSCW